MNVKSIWKKALIVSMVVSLTYTTIITIISGGSSVFLSTSDHVEVKNMLYPDGVEFLHNRAMKITRWESLTNGIRVKYFWFNAIQDWLIYTAICFSSCIFLLRSIQLNK
jgi:hypothetical protein